MRVAVLVDRTQPVQAQTEGRVAAVAVQSILVPQLPEMPLRELRTLAVVVAEGRVPAVTKLSFLVRRVVRVS